MDVENQMVLDNIDEFVNDENKVVTYKWLSLTLSIHVNLSKRLLEEYVKQHPELQTIYFITGTVCRDTGQEIHCRLAKGSSLNDVKSKFDEVTSCHIYSTQKSVIKTADVLHQVDMDIIQEKVRQLPVISSIRCKTAEKYDETRLKRTERIDIKESEPTVRITAPSNGEIKKEKAKKESPPLNFFPTKSKGKSSSTDKKEEKKPDEKNSDKSSKKESKNAKPDISKAFAKSTVKKEKPKKEESKKDEATISQEDSSKNHKDNVKTVNEELENMDVSPPPERGTSKKRKAVIDQSESEDEFESFMKRNKNKETDDVEPKYSPPTSKKTSGKQQSDSEDEDVDVVAPTPEPVKVKAKTKRRKTEKTQQTQENQLNKPKEKKKEEKKPSEGVKEEKKPNEGEKEEDKDVIPSPDNNNKSKRRKRRRVLKSKQFVNEEGFMVTQKAYESESYSDDSETEISEEKHKTLSTEKQNVIATKKTVKELEKKTKQHQTKSKHQASLTSFFKRK